MDVCFSVSAREGQPPLAKMVMIPIFLPLVIGGIKKIQDMWFSDCFLQYWEINKIVSSAISRVFKESRLYHACFVAYVLNGLGVVWSLVEVGTIWTNDQPQAGGGYDQ